MTGLILGAVLAVVVLVILTTIRSLIIICPPNRVAVISGRSRQLSDGRTVGYRAIRGGRTLRVLAGRGPASADLKKKARRITFAPRFRLMPAATYSPMQLPTQYHRRYQA